MTLFLLLTQFDFHLGANKVYCKSQQYFRYKETKRSSTRVPRAAHDEVEDVL